MSRERKFPKAEITSHIWKDDEGDWSWSVMVGAVGWRAMFSPVSYAARIARGGAR